MFTFKSVEYFLMLTFKAVRVVELLTKNKGQSQKRG